MKDLAEVILEHLRDGGGSLSRRDLHGLFGRNVKAFELDQAVSGLVARQLVHETTLRVAGTGRPRKVIWLR